MKKVLLTLLVVGWTVPAGASFVVNGGIGYYQPSDPVIASRYGDSPILTFSFGGEIRLLKRLSTRAEYELMDTRPRRKGKIGPRWVKPGSRDLVTSSVRLGISGYPFSSADSTKAFYVGVGGTYRHITDILWVRRGNTAIADKDETTEDVFGPYAMIGARLGGFSLEASYDWLAIGSADLPYGSAGGFVLKAGIALPMGR